MGQGLNAESLSFDVATVKHSSAEKIEYYYSLCLVRWWCRAEGLLMLMHILGFILPFSFFFWGVRDIIMSKSALLAD